MKNYKIVFFGFFTLILFLIPVLVFNSKNGYSEFFILNSAEKKENLHKQEAPDTIINTTVDKKYLLGKFNPAEERVFVEVDLKYANRKGLYLRKETYEAFIKMFEATLKDGIELSIISATRNFKTQKYLWERKWSGKKLVSGKNLAKNINNPIKRARIILKYSSMPGTSRHHWGTDIDLNKDKNDYFLTDKGKKIYKWLKENAHVYGFCQTYTQKDSLRATGYEEEKWHWSYIPLAKFFLAQYINKVSYDDLKGFMGWETAKEIKVMQNYVLAINKDCK